MASINTGTLPEEVVSMLPRIEIVIDGHKVPLAALVPSDVGKSNTELTHDELVMRLCRILDDQKTFTDRPDLVWGPCEPGGLVARVSVLKMWYEKLCEHHDGFMDRLIDLDDALKNEPSAVDLAAQALVKQMAYQIECRRAKLATPEPTS